MRTPKELFLVSGYSEAFKKIIGNEAFEPACHYALMQLQSEMPPTTLPGTPSDPYISMDANSQMFGARRLLAILHSLSDPVKPPTPPKRESLNYGS